MNYSQFIPNLLDLLFPRPTSVIRLEQCSVQTLLKNLPPAKQHPLPYIESAFEYRNPLTKKIVWEIKYRNNTNLTKKIATHLHDILLEQLSEDSLFNNAQPPVLVPIPISDHRKKTRGFNQALLLAHYIYQTSPETYRKIATPLVYKKNYIPQTTIKHKGKRMENINNCFRIHNSKEIQKENIILIDDVSTTGATLKEARKILLEHGAKHVRAITIAH